MPEHIEDDKSRKAQLWRPIDPKIWTPGPHPSILKRVVGRVRDFIAPAFITTMVILGPLSILISMFIIYSLVPLRFFGMTFIIFWAAMTAGFILVLERTGYARNFEDWNFPLKRLIAVPIAFLMVLGILFLLLVIAHRSIF